MIHKPDVHDPFILSSVEKNGAHAAGLIRTAEEFEKKFGIKRTPRAIEARYYRIRKARNGSSEAAGMSRFRMELDAHYYSLAAQIEELRGQIAEKREAMRIFAQLIKTSRRFDKT